MGLDVHGTQDVNSGETLSKTAYQHAIQLVRTTSVQLNHLITESVLPVASR